MTEITYCVISYRAGVGDQAKPIGIAVVKDGIFLTKFGKDPRDFEGNFELFNDKKSTGEPIFVPRKYSPNDDPTPEQYLQMLRDSHVAHHDVTVRVENAKTPEELLNQKFKEYC